MLHILISLTTLIIGLPHQSITQDKDVSVPPISIVWPENFATSVTDANQISSVINPLNLVQPYDWPKITYCENYYISYIDVEYIFNKCHKIIRHWTVECEGVLYEHDQVIKVFVNDGPILPCTP